MQPQIALRPTTAHVNLDALAHNIRCMRAHLSGQRVMAVVKANAYGHGLVPVAQAMLRNGADELGVAFLEEGIALRRAGITAPILVLGGIIGNQIKHYFDFDLMLTASSVFKLQQIEEVAAALNKQAQVHLKIDTGMERIGMHWDTASALLEAGARDKHCMVRGVFSHLAQSESVDSSYTKLQLERFSECTDWYQKHSEPTPIRHLANSGAILQHEDTWFDLVRPGLILYGVCPSERLQSVLPLQPVMSLETRVVYFKVVRAGCPVSYDCTWAPEADTRVVTLPVGYGDGYPRAFSNRACVLIGGRRHPVVGRVTMDATMVNISDSSAYNSDPVVLLGPQGDDVIRVEDWAAWAGTIPYEILTTLNTRIPRVYLGDS